MASEFPKSRQKTFDMSLMIADNLYSQYESLTSVPEFRLCFDPPYKKKVAPVPDEDTRVSAFMMDIVYLLTYCALDSIDRIQPDALMPVIILDHRLHSSPGDEQILTLDAYDRYISSRETLSYVMGRLKGYREMCSVKLTKSIEIQSLEPLKGTEKTIPVISAFDEFLRFETKSVQTLNENKYGLLLCYLNSYLPAEVQRKKERKLSGFDIAILVFDIVTAPLIIWYFCSGDLPGFGCIVSGIWFIFWLLCIIPGKPGSSSLSYHTSYPSSSASSSPSKLSGSRYGWLDEFDMTKDYYGKHGEFDRNDESRSVSEDIQQFHNGSPNTDLHDHYYWDDILDAKTDGYLDD